MPRPIVHRGKHRYDPPVDQFLYGPSAGVNSVRSGAAPQTVTKPVGANDISVGQLTQTTLNNLGVGAKLWVLAGVHNASGLQPLQNQEIVHQPGAIVDGGSAGEYIYGSGNTGVKIRGGLLRNAGGVSSSSSAAAILAAGGSVAGGWLVEDVEVATSYNFSVHFQAPNCIARRVYSHDGGRYNFSASTNGGSQPRYTGIRIENCHSRNGNTRQLNPGDNAGASKFTNCDGLYVGYGWFDDTTAWGGGFGIWPDFAHRNTIIEENVCEGLRGSGVFYEASYGGTEIRRNALFNCGEKSTPTDEGDEWLGKVGLLLSSSDPTLEGTTTGIEIHHNLIDGEGIQLGFVDHGGHPQDVKNHHFYENDVWLRGSQLGVVGGRQHQDEATSPWNSGNTYEDNHYHAPNTALARWTWGNTQGQSPMPKLTWAQWQALGHDNTGSLVTI
jgi:hypothetical protein